MDLILTGALITFWVCGVLVIYAYAGYPIVIACLARCFGRSAEAPASPSDNLPSLSLLIAAYNEEAVIEERIQNGLALDYPFGKLEIIVASDGSSDATPAIVRRYADRGVRLLDYKRRRGKAAVLNSAIAELNGDVLLFSDANTFMDPTAARRIVRWFRDPRVGVVCGRLVLTDPRTGRNADSLYWMYETFLKECEGRLGGPLGSNGAIYAIRRPLYVPIPDGTIVDDFVIPLLAKLRSGCDLRYDREAVAREETAPNVRSEFHRRSRIGAGGFQSIGLLWRLLDPRRGWIAFTFSSHKILRWLCPFFLLGLAASNLFLAHLPFYRGALLGQLAFYALSLLAVLVPGRFKALRPLRLATMFTSMNAALLVGFCRWLRGSQNGAWRRTTRLAEAAEGVR
jgi:cellulose synthase/poly-beta-1,6-N-acetylglucosamine synthase-like glycosyltransferase